MNPGKMALNNKQNTVLICPLDWGLGHASRDVLIIKTLLSNNFKVIIAANNAPLAFLSKEFPELAHIKMPSVGIKYPKGKRMAIKMLFLAPKLIFGIYWEHWQLKKIIRQQKIDVVISDSRFGLWNKNVYSIFISHQTEIQTPRFLNFTKPIINTINLWFINKFNDYWIPDLPKGDNIAGSLAHAVKMPGNSKYIGLLSRFGFTRLAEKKYDIAVILSGPEPQRSIFEQIAVQQIEKTNYKTIVLLGKPKEGTGGYAKAHIKYVNHLGTKDLQQVISESEVVISRSGYSSIMDYVSLQKNAILIPTPGQTEQEYLAKRLKKKHWFYSMEQNGFDLQKAISKYKNYHVPHLSTSAHLLSYEIRKLQKKLYL